MHIAEGVLSGPVLITGVSLAAAGTAVGLKCLDPERIAQAGLLSSAFFVASLIHVPIGPSNIHLVLNGIVGLLLGWVAVPALLVALLLQAVLFQFGGLTTLGVNTVIMAAPAVGVHYLFRSLIWRKPIWSLAAAFACGFTAVLSSSLIAALALMFSAEGFWRVAAVLMGAHFPVMIIEGVITAFCVAFLKKVHPVMLPAGRGRETR